MKPPRSAHTRFGSRIGRAGRHPRRGQSLVEFALVLPIFILLLAGIADFGIGLYQYMTVINSARVGARFGTLNATNPSAIVNAAQSAGIGSSATVTVSCWSVVGNGNVTTPTSAPGGAGWGTCSASSPNPTTSGDTIAVTVTYNYSMILPLTFGHTIPMSSTVQMMVE